MTLAHGLHNDYYDNSFPFTTFSQQHLLDGRSFSDLPALLSALSVTGSSSFSFFLLLSSYDTLADIGNNHNYTIHNNTNAPF